MKTIVSFLFCHTFVFPVFGTVLTISNAPNQPAQFFSVQEAANAAASGDTLYIQGTGIDYFNVNIDKKLSIIGSGHHPRKQFGGNITLLNTIYLLPGSKGTQINGIRVNKIQFENAGFPASAITIKNCFMGGIFAFPFGNADSIIIEKNIITGELTIQGGSTNVIIQNNIFTSSGQKGITYLNSGLVRNNLFFHGVPGADIFQYTSGLILENNIFYRAEPSGTVNSVFNNNLTYQTFNPNLPYGSNTGSGNLAGLDPQFANLPSSDETFSYQHNYRLSAVSPGHNAGTDGTDIGIYGNNITFSMTGEPDFLPVIRTMDISNTNVPLNGELKLKFKVTTAKPD